MVRKWGVPRSSTPSRTSAPTQLRYLQQSLRPQNPNPTFSTPTLQISYFHISILIRGGSIPYYHPLHPAMLSRRLISSHHPRPQMSQLAQLICTRPLVRWKYGDKGGGELMMMVRIKRMRVQVVDLAFVRERKYSNMFGRRGGIRLSILELSVEC